MSGPICKRSARGRKAAFALTALLACLVSTAVPAAGAPGAGEGAADTEPAARWTRTLALDLSARELGLPGTASAQRLARAALKRKGGRLGLRGSTGSLRLASRLRMPPADGARALTHLRFHQTAGSLRVVWSQIDVTIAAGKLSSISATVVPVKTGRPAGERRVSRKRALGIAMRAVPGAEQALRPLPAAYAGTPSAARAAKPRRPRRAWVVELQPPAAPGDQTPTGLCIVVDAQSGKVIAKWPGMADRPDRGPNARGAEAAFAGVRPAIRNARASQDPRENPSTVLQVFDGTGQQDPAPHREAPLYSSFMTTGGTRDNANWPSYQEARLDGASPTTDMEAISANAANAARTICVVRGWCGSVGSFQPGATRVLPWVVIGNTNDDDSHADKQALRVFIEHRDIMYGNGDPNQPFNDIVAHEFGHIIDWIYAGDRSAGQNGEGDSVEEALADMFAYDYDRGDAYHGEDRPSGLASRNLAIPGVFRRDGQPYPAHMDDYDDTPPDDAPHFNSTILSHAYYLFVQRVGHQQAGRVLHNVPQRLSPRPVFGEVARSFSQSANVIYGATVSAHARAAFTEVGLASPPHQEPNCGPDPC